MFFFFVGGVDQQVGRVLKPGIAKCIYCGSKADLVDYDKVLKLFFVPVWKWPGKEPLLYCNNCKLFFPPSFGDYPEREEDKGLVAEAMRCRFCGRGVEPEFRFCPFCGSSL